MVLGDHETIPSSSRYALCVDFGGTRVKVGVVDQTRILVQSAVPAAAPNLLVEVRAAATDLLTRLGTLDRPAVAAVAVPGIVGRDAGTLVGAHGKHAALHGVDLRAWLADVAGIPRARTVIENDARAGLVGELSTRGCAGVRDAVLMVLGTGIGTAAMINGQLLRGRRDHAGILGGHATVDLDGPDCNCGNVGCGEAIASTWALGGLLHSVDPGRVVPAGFGFLDLFAQIDAGDQIATEAWRRAVVALSATAVNLCHAYDPDVLILAGGPVQRAELVVPPLRAWLDAHLWSTSHRPRIHVSDDPEYAVLRGLAHLTRTDRSSR